MARFCRIFVSEYKHLGRLIVLVDGSTTRVASGLGIGRYTFDLLPSSSDNTYVLLRLTLKHFFEKTLSRERLEEVARSSKRTSEYTIGQFFKSFFSSNLTLPQSVNFSENLLFLISRCIEEEYRWDNIDGYEEFGGIYAPEELFDVCFPLYVMTDAWRTSKRYFQAAETKAFLETSSSVAASREYLSVFYESEAKYISKAKKILSEIAQGPYFQNIIKAFSDVVNCYEKFMEECLGRRQNDSGTHDENVVIGSDIVRELKAKIHYLEPYREFMKICGRVMSYESEETPGIMKWDHNLSNALAFIVQKITNIPRALSLLLSPQDSLDDVCCFVEFNKTLNCIAESSAMKRDRLCIMAKYWAILEHNTIHQVFISQKLIGKLTGYSLILKGNKPTENLKVRILLFENTLLFFSENYSFLGEVSNHSTTLSIFSGVLFVFGAPKRLQSGFFSSDSISGQLYIPFRYENRESTREFAKAFYSSKYNTNISIGDLLIIPSNSRFGNSLYVEAEDESAEPLYSVGYQGVALRRHIPLNKIETEVKSLREELMEVVPDEKKAQIRIMHMYLNPHDIVSYTLDIQPDADVSYNRLKKIIDLLLLKILNDRNLKPETEMLYNEESNIINLESKLSLLKSFKLSESSFLVHYNHSIVEWVVRKYITMIEGYVRIDVMSLERLYILFMLFLERNLYYFFTTESVEKNRHSLLENNEISCAGFDAYIFLSIQKVYAYYPRIALHLLLIIAGIAHPDKETLGVLENSPFWSQNIVIVE